MNVRVKNCQWLKRHRTLTPIVTENEKGLLHFLEILKYLIKYV